MPHAHLSRAFRESDFAFESDSQSNGRLLQSSPLTGVTSSGSRFSSPSEMPAPVSCLRLGDGIFFDVSSGTYPVYSKDSLLNTNDDFDYGAFRRLDEAMRSSSNVSVFAFTFTEPGTYVFRSSESTSQRLIVVVMAAGSECPTDGPIVPQTESNMILVGARRSDDILLEVNWRLIIGVLAGFSLCVALTVLALYYF